MLVRIDDIRVCEGERTLGDEETATWLGGFARIPEMPGLHSTLPQMRRLWGLTTAACSVLANALVEQRFLAKTAGDSYVLRQASV